MRSSSRRVIPQVDQNSVNEPSLVQILPPTRSYSHGNAVLNSPTRHVNDSMSILSLSISDTVSDSGFPELQQFSEQVRKRMRHHSTEIDSNSISIASTYFLELLP